MLYNNQDTRPQEDLDAYGVRIEDDGDSWGMDESAPIPGQPAPLDGNQPKQDNDQIRYQYWQSQADLMKNENAMLKQQMEQLNGRLSQFEQVMAKQNEPEPEQEEPFPDPPQAPVRPYGFSQQEAMSDPSSESARYLVAMTEYNSTMNQYNNLRNQWLESRQNDKFEELNQGRQVEAQEAQRRAQVAEQINQIVSIVQQKYGVDYETAIDFVNTMSDNSSITVDNLFELYKLRKGGGGQQMGGKYMPGPSQYPQYNPYGAPIGPSPDFLQRQRAQSVPPTMGVHNAKSQQIDDPMIRMFKDVIDRSNKNVQF